MNATISRLHRLAADAPATDGALLEAFLAGDHTAFAQLVRRHAGLVFATCRRVLRHQQDAEDAFQAVFLVLARRAGDVWPRDAVGSWLFGVAHRVALKARTTRSRRTGREAPLEDTATTEPTARDFETADAVHRVVAKLPEVYRAAVVACDLQGLSRKEAAERLGWSEGTLSGRLSRARALLAVRLRRLGFSAPAGTAVLVLPEVVSGSLVQSACALVAGGTVPAPVLALTEGAVRSMAVFKLKAMAAVVFAVCALGYGALAASGPGPGDISGEKQQQPQPQRGGAVGGGAALAPPKPASDLDPLQGEWFAVSVSEGDKVQLRPDSNDWVLTVSGYSLKMPYKVAGENGWKQREYKIAVDGTTNPKTIDMIDGNNPVAQGLYEFAVPPKACAACHAGGDRYLIPGQELIALCAAAQKPTAQGKAPAAGLRLALSIDGKRPAKFGGPGVIVFELVRRTDDSDAARERLIAERKKVIARLLAAANEREKEALEVELKRLQDRLDALVAGTQQKAEAAVRTAQKQLQQAQLDAENAQLAVLVATANLDRARANLAAAEKALADLQKPKPAPAKDEPVFTVHVRTLTAAEKVIRVKATGTQTVLEGLVYAADDVPLKTEGVNVWVVRDKAVLQVDLPGITKNGETKTNYVLKAGDQLFVQSKPAK